MDQLEGRVAVVTGAASGIGLAVVAAFVAEGMRVVLTDRDDESLTLHTARLRDEGAVVRSMVADVTDAESVEAVGQFVTEEFGEREVAVNNAGIVNGGNSWELPLDEWHRVIDVNLW